MRLRSPRSLRESAKNMIDQTARHLLHVIFTRCMFCSGYSRREVKGCRVTDCPLWPYRNGKLPEEPSKHPEQLRGQTDMFEILKQGE